MFIIPIKVKWLAIADAVYFAFIMLTYIISGRLWAGLLPIIAVLNFLVFFGDYLFGSLKHGSSRYSANTINFKRAAKQAKKNVDSQPYRHKCAVCGRTDVDHPELEFRYCSRCTGYHCFCMDHINSHVHFRD